MQYQQAISWLYSLHRFGGRLGLNNTHHLLKQLGNPEREIFAVHVGGTNGKGSVCAMLASILQEAGYCVGTYTSPHLNSFRERIIVNNEPIPKNDVARLVNELRPICDEIAEKSGAAPTFFEITTSMGLKYFEEQKVDLAVLEVGMGGKLDATNVCNSLVSVITKVALDHTDHLGTAIPEIAREKAGIIKKGSMVTTAATGEGVKVIEAKCKQKDAKLIRVGKEMRYKGISSQLKKQKFKLQGINREYSNLEINLPGEHQLFNASLAVGAAECLELLGFAIDRQHINRGLSRARWHGRLELVRREPYVLLDCAHNPNGAKALRKSLSELFTYRKLILVIGMCGDKDIGGFVEQLAPLADKAIVCKAKVKERAAEPAKIVKELKKYTEKIVIRKEVKNAIKNAISIAEREDLICISGSIFVVGEAREFLCN